MHAIKWNYLVQGLLYVQVFISASVEEAQAAEVAASDLFQVVENLLFSHG